MDRSKGSYTGTYGRKLNSRSQRGKGPRAQNTSRQKGAAGKEGDSGYLSQPSSPIMSQRSFSPKSDTLTLPEISKANSLTGLNHVGAPEVTSWKASPRPKPSPRPSPLAVKEAPSSRPLAGKEAPRRQVNGTDRRHKAVTKPAKQKQKSSKQGLLAYVRESVIGSRSVFHGPFGDRRIIYCDYTASGKPLEFIERYIEEHVYPFYANTHTTSSVSSQQTTQFRKDARKIIKECVNASDDDSVIFTGSGTTAAIHKLIHVMDIQHELHNTVVIHGPFEHHSNILPWKELGVQVERVGLDKEHGIDLDELRMKLEKHKPYNIIGTFSACSNVTGIMVDTDVISEIVHTYNGIVIWDYASAAPYLKIDMNAPGKKYKDAVVCSPHKFVGGVGTPGLLIAKKRLFTNNIPGNCGGGTVVYVTRDTHFYVDDIEEKEEGGTPAIVESIRAGMTFQIKRAIGEDVIEHREEILCKRAIKTWSSNRNILILGGTRAHRLPVFSFLVRHPESGKLLHHNFVCTLLNDLYGVQSRGGCACAGPYAQDLLGMPENIAQKFASFLLPPACREEEGEVRNLGIIKPGFSRLNLAYFLDDETVDFIIHAVDMVATYGWKLLPMYTYDPGSGDWFHNEFKTKVRSLYDISFDTGRMEDHGVSSLDTEGDSSLQAIMQESDNILKNAEDSCQEIHLSEDIKFSLNEHMDLLWFLLPQQAMFYLTNPDEAGFFGVYRPIASNQSQSRPGTQLDKDQFNILKRQLTQLSISHKRGGQKRK